MTADYCSEGTVTVQAEYADGSPVQTGVRILQADPKVRIAVELLQQINHLGPPPGWITRDGDVLTIRDSHGQKFIYVLGDVADRDEHGRALSFWMEWPD